MFKSAPAAAAFTIAQIREMTANPRTMAHDIHLGHGPQAVTDTDELMAIAKHAGLNIKLSVTGGLIRTNRETRIVTLSGPAADVATAVLAYQVSKFTGIF